MNSFSDIVQAIHEKRMVYKVREGQDNTTVIRVYSSDIQPASAEFRVPSTKPAAEYDVCDVAQKVETALLNGEIKPVKDCCNYILKVYLIKSKKEAVKGIFPTIKEAKEHAAFMDDLFWGTNITYIDAPDGIHICGEESLQGGKRKWYTPEKLEAALVYDSKTDEVVRLDELLTYEKWWELTNINKMKQDMPHPDAVEKNSVPCTEPGGTGQTAKLISSVLLNELENKNIRMSAEEMTSFIDRISRTELLTEISELSDRPITPRYLKAIRVSLIELGYDQSWVETEFRHALEEKYIKK